MWAFVLFTLGQVAPPLSPADAIAQAHADLAKLPRDVRPFVRHLSLYSTPASERPRLIAVLNGHVNALSREPDLTPLAIVPGTQASLLRVILKDYAWTSETWDKLFDPAFTAIVETEIVEPWPDHRPWEDGKRYPRGSFEWKHRKRTQAFAPWLIEDAAAQVRLAEVLVWSQSKAPVVRADFFLWTTGAQAGRSPGYYDFLDIKNEKDFQELVGADVKIAERRRTIWREAVGVSGVTLQSRALQRQDGFGSAYYRTFDFIDNKDGKNPLRVLGRDIEKEFDATEQYGRLPNGLWATGLFNRKGEAQATAPDNIASDGSSRTTDRRVHVNISCVRCHANGGLQDIDAWVRNIGIPPLDLKSPDYDRDRERKREYFRNLDAKINEDRAVYEVAIKEITGLNSKEYAAAYSAAFDRYDEPVGLDEVVAELGTTRAKFVAALDARVRAKQGDTVFPVLLLKNPRINRIPRRTWDESFAEAQLLLRGYRQ